MTVEHDPTDAVGTAPASVCTAWESLQSQANELAELAARVASLPPHERVVRDGDETVDLLADLAARANAIQSVAAACRRDTWEALRDQGWTLVAIGARWGCSAQAVSQALKRGGRVSPTS